MIKSLKAREILDSRGNPTVEVELATENGLFFGHAPSGASKGSKEIPELRDKTRYLGKGVQQAVKLAGKVNLKSMDETRQGEIDELLIHRKHEMFSNVSTPISIAVCKAGAAAQGMEVYDYIAKLAEIKPELPTPYMNIINGGKHADDNLQIQEFMIIPRRIKNSSGFADKIEQCVNVYHMLYMLLKKSYGNLGVGDEGGFTPPLETTEQALDIIEKAIEELGYSMKLGIDAAASEFFSGRYNLDGKKLDSGELVDYYLTLARKYPIISIEDPFHENDWLGFSELTARFKGQVVGDDLLVTNVTRVKEAIERKACNCLLLKINQVGTITGALEAFHKARKAGWNTIVSHRSAETCDSFIADLAVGLKADIKTGAPARGERTAKYNRLLRISENKSFRN
jgi:enolase